MNKYNEFISKNQQAMFIFEYAPKNQSEVSQQPTNYMLNPMTTGVHPMMIPPNNSTPPLVFNPNMMNPRLQMHPMVFNPMMNNQQFYNKTPLKIENNNINQNKFNISEEKNKGTNYDSLNQDDLANELYEYIDKAYPEYILNNKAKLER